MKILLHFLGPIRMADDEAALPQNKFLSWLALPTIFWCFMFVLGPLAFVFVYAFLKRGTYGGVEWIFTFENFTRAFEFIYLRIFFESVKIALGSSILCVVIAFPIALMMSQSRPSVRKLILALLLLPFLVNCVLRTTAIKAVLAAAEKLFGDEFNFSPDLKVWIGMVTAYLPFAVLPIYVSLEKFDFSLLEAARDLGAPPLTRFVKVMFPLIRPGLITALTLVFVPALCEFLIPDFLGGAKNMLIGGLISKQFLDSRDWPFGSALSVLLIAVIFAVMSIESFLLRIKSDDSRKNLNS